MNSETASRIIALNHQFYQSFANDFSETRLRLQPGVLKSLKRLLQGSNILDLGCGNGQLAQTLVREGFSGVYLGLDFSSNLLEEALQKNYPGAAVQFSTFDFTQPTWDLPLAIPSFDIIVCFAALHHIPGDNTRLQICQNLRQLISQGGTFYLSNWQFLNSKRFQDRIIPWEEAGFVENEVDRGDFLLDWRRGGSGIRYVHHFTEEELEQLALQSKFKIIETYYSDGKEGNLSLYQVWEPV